MQLRYDLNVGALYIRLSGRAISRSREVDGNTVVDLDEAGVVVGIEVLSIEHPWPLADVLRDCSIPPGEAAQLRAYFEPSLTLPSQEVPALSIERNAPVSVPA